MANRQLAQRTETDVVLPDDRKGEMWETGASLLKGGLDLKQKYDVAQMNNFAAQSQLDMQKVTQEWRIKNEGNPLDETAMSELNKSYDEILGQYDNKIGFLSRGDWAAVKNKIKMGSQQQNQQWGFTQSVKNAENNINTSIKTNLLMASQFGAAGDIQQARAHYADAVIGLDAFAEGVIGPESKKKLTSDFKSDYMKSFLIGQAQVDPDKVLASLDAKNENGENSVLSDIGSPEDIATIRSFAVKQKTLMARQQKELRDESVNNTYLDIINQKASFESIDQGVADGKYDAKDAIFLKKILVKASPTKDDKLTIARYMDALAGLPIDDKEEAQKVMENIMADDRIKDDTKEVLLFDTDIGTEDSPMSLSDVAGGKKKKPSSKWFWGLFQGVNRNDAVDAFIRFKKTIQGDESPAMIKQKAHRAISDVSLENNPALSSLTEDWTDMVDANGTTFMARMSQDGIVETKLSASSDENSSNDTSDEDPNNGD